MEKNDPRPAVFLDRDGLLIEDRGFIGDIADVFFYDFTFESLKKLQSHFDLFIVTNQSGIGKGINTVEQVKAVNDYVLRTLSDNGIVISELFVCPHDFGENCICRKPSPHFAFVVRDKYGIDLSKSYMIGDHKSDADFARNFGGQGIFVLTGHGESHRDEITEYPVMPSLKEAVELILSEIESDRLL
ncbi:MAG TPA: HAD-IIIA family hydrolase [Spirochaetota bacterium]|jgi:D-glycero-D-manno-heptose 1,7-bisphosphate phosphatase|nr:HAD-IIIA family hydrolase [Spirochaetota bacterium]HOH36909.1 HAD-IIIA family hydrolase [Spirochaetota bacterium]HPW52199.1 HAD-IIIA family hydrolase [Spirochaetota bacterium]HPY02952.1 HAD-IIIA family hydrolase [Spirochaetota bacterium]HQA52352.1 HAD-IIIA family hydrolase [Spirochaetota bacterium]